ncbi:hypothetical protein K2173_002396 [Erythroxylum novogranatense]|uniref:Alpha/beta hydrolase fold-3 domain-containing protein n=1 Tax=Erythroxylum novogranatense TaxID=1862640 RepID=A0AAV8T9Z8_9ROSI|nr:hypothetical protein K2173_002396 [Erythroxylum novogranatense]
MATDAASDVLTRDFPGFFKIYKDGRVERYWNTDFTPAGLDSETGVQSKDVVICPEAGVKARIFLPKIEGVKKLPLLVHYHGGGFCIGSPFATPFKVFLSHIVTQANVIAISVDYRLAPEHLLPAAYNDSWAALQWVAKHAGRQGPEPWINEHADLQRVVLAGESAGANLAHYVAVQAGANELSSLKIANILVIHPYFGTKDPDRFYQYMCPTSSGADDDPKLNPGADPNLKKMKCDGILVCVAEKDKLKSRGVSYYETMSRSSNGSYKVDFYETKGEDHCFHFFNPKSENIGPLMKKIVDFVNQDE